jgi:phosphate-selective porin OprO/OprP
MSLDGQEKKKEEPKAEPKPEAEFRATFTDGFHIKTTDGNFDLHIGGRWLEEYRYTFNRPTDGATAAMRTSTNSFYIREAFISLDGTLYKDWGFKLNGDFSPTAGALIEEAWVEYKPAKELKFYFGQFKGPISMETMDSPRFLETIQRSPMARFVPGLDLGMRVEGGFWDNLLYYQLALTNGRSHVVNAGRNQIDDNDGKEYMGRLQVAPFTADKDSILNGLKFGVYGSFSHIGEGATINSAGWPGNLATNELAVTYLVFPAAPNFRFAGDRYRVGGEATYFTGPFMVRGEVMERTDEYSVNATGAHDLLRTIGYYAVATVVLTGEKKLPNTRLAPLHPLNFNEGTWGAVELVARFANVSLSRSELTEMAVDFTQNSNRVSEITLGANWWPSANTRFSVDYISEDYHQGVQLSAGHHGSHLNGVLARFQVDF